MKILIACEYSGIAKEAFMKKGHRVISCDLLPALKHGSSHWIEDVRLMIKGKLHWDMIIAFPPPDDKELIKVISEAPYERIAIENPPSRLPRSHIRQIFKPYPGMRCSALWLKGLRPLIERDSSKLNPAFNKHTEALEHTDEWLAREMSEQWG